MVLVHGPEKQERPWRRHGGLSRSEAIAYALPGKRAAG